MEHMRRPDDERLKAALAAIDRLAEEGADPEHIASVMHYLHERCSGLESLLMLTDRYLRFGMPEHELSQMRRLVEQLREPDLASGHSHEVDGTLPI